MADGFLRSSVASPCDDCQWGGCDGDQQCFAGLRKQCDDSGAAAVRVSYDPVADAAYIRLADEIGAGGVAFTHSCDPAEVDGMIHLDFDAGGRLVGIEVFEASSKLPPELLAKADIRG